MPREQFFWRNEPITVRRLKDILRKVRQRGGTWLAKRLLKECRIPETTEGIYIRRVIVGLYNAVLIMFSPIIVLTEMCFRRDFKTLHYFYDLEVSPITFDIADYLVMAEMERRRRGYDHFYVYIVPGRNGGLRDEGETYEKLVDPTNRLWRLSNLVIPMFGLFPSCSGYSVCRSRQQATLLRILATRSAFPKTYWPAFPIGLFRRSILDAARRDHAVFPAMKSPEQSLRYVRQWLHTHVADKKAVTITVRQYGFEPLRNSNLEAWAEFARSLDPDQYAPIFLLDTDVAMDTPPDAIREFCVFREGPWNLGLRSALYEAAHINLAIVHGPTELLWYNDRCRYVLFVPPVNTGQSELKTMRANGFVPGESLPFATPFQKWVWEQDDLPVIQREFTRMCDAIVSHTGLPDRELNPA